MNWKIKLYRAIPMASGMAVLGIEELLVYIYQPGDGLWALGALALPVIVWIVLDRRFRRFDWYPYHKSELEPVDGNCPKCGSGEIYKTGRVSRCMDCRTEGIGPLSPRST